MVTRNQNTENGRAMIRAVFEDNAEGILNAIDQYVADTGADIDRMIRITLEAGPRSYAAFMCDPQAFAKEVARG